MEEGAPVTTLTDTLKGIEKEMGAGSIFKLGSREALDIEAIPTGSPSLDIALGIGGVPRGRIVEIFGGEAAGKTTLLYHIIANAQKRGGVCAFVDSENAIDPGYAEAIGVDVDALYVNQPDFGEQGLEIANRLVESGEVAVVAVDSIAALTPRAELEGQMGEQTVGLLARLMSQALRKLAGSCNRTGTTCVFTNQIRSNISTFGYGPKETQPGGRALKYYASQRLDIRRIENLKQGEEVTGIRSRVKVVKNKVAPPFTEALLEIDFGKGISREGATLDLALEQGLIKQNGAWFSCDGEQIGQGRHAAKAHLRENPALAEEIERQLR